MNQVLGNDFKYYLTVDNIRKEIVFAPEFWERTSISYKRDLEYFGVIRSFGLPLTFVEDGAEILRRAYYNGGVQAGVRLEVELLNKSTLQYELAYTSDIDFSKAEDSKDRFTVTLMETGVTDLVKAYDNVKYEIDLVGDDVVNMELPGVAFNESSSAIFLQPAGYGVKFIPPTNIVTSAFTSGFAEVQNVDIQSASDTGFNTSESWFLKCNVGNPSKNIRVQGTLKIKSQSFIGGNSEYSVRVMNNFNVTEEILFSSTSFGEFQFNFDFSVPMTLGFKYFFYIRVNSDSATVVVKPLEGNFVVSYDAVSNPSPCKGLKSMDLFKRLMNKISPVTPVDSYLLTSTWADLIFTSGNAIREIPNSKIKISLKEFFQTFEGIDDAGMGQELGVMRIELKTFFARNALAVNVGEVGDDSCKIKCAERFLASRIKIGYDDGNTEETNGLQEYNSGQEWQLPITRVQTTKDWTSGSRADQYGIERLRREFNVLKTTRGSDDTPSDNDTFMVDCYLDGTVYRPILGSSYTSVTGLTSPLTAYNLRITPKKNLLRKGSYLRGVMDKMDGFYINFASSDKNAQLKTIKDGVSVQENENILVFNLDAKYFIPHIASITCKTPVSVNKMFDANPFGFVSFIWKGVTLKGYILECSAPIAINTEQEFELLLTADNNLLNLINV